MSKIELRSYQQELINNIKRSLFQGNRRVCAVLGCGGGKSVIQGTIARMTTDKGGRVLFLVHRQELCNQISATFAACDVNPLLCQIGMVQTISRRLAKTAPPSLILVDECHHILSNSYKRILDFFSNAYVLGFTATPSRMNEGGLGSVFSDLIMSVSTEWLIKNHYLSPYKYYGVELADTSKLHTKNGDFDKAEVEALMNRSAIFGSAVTNWVKYAEGKRTIIYCSSIKTSEETVEAFRREGVQAYHLDGATPKGERSRVVEAFRRGEVEVLSNVDLFGEGFDVPDCECVVLLRPTKSLTLHIQQSMRSMRYKEGKTALILDHVGNFKRHGLPDDEREWSLVGKKKKEKNQVLIKQCPVCFSVCKNTTDICPICGYVWEKVERAEREVVEDVELREISKLPHNKYTECKTWEELEVFRKAHKYKFMWSLHKAVDLGIDIPPKYRYQAYKFGILGRNGYVQN